MNANEVIKAVRTQHYHPVYLLDGEESFFIDQIAGAIEDTIQENEKGFDLTILYGKETDVKTLVGAAKRFPMVADHQVVILREAQGMRNLEGLVPYLQNPLKKTLLVVEYKNGKLDRRTQLYKAFSQNGLAFESKKLYDNKLPDFIEAYVKTKGFSIGPKASLLMGEYLGNDLSKIVGELDKLIINLAPGQDINIRTIEKNVGISKEFTIFDLTTALGKKDVLKCYTIAFYMADNAKDNPIVVILGTLYAFFSKVMLMHSLQGQNNATMAVSLGVNPYFIADYQNAARNYSREHLVSIFSSLREADVRSKGVDSPPSVTQGDLLKELVFKILNH